jgi:hypothetical protein
MTDFEALESIKLGSSACAVSRTELGGIAMVTVELEF